MKSCSQVVSLLLLWEQKPPREMGNRRQKPHHLSLNSATESQDPSQVSVTGKVKYKSNRARVCSLGCFRMPNVGIRM